MNPFGGTPKCPRCSKSVYAAEQVMGPARKMYHKPCLTCKSCNKRLDSYSLVEHDSEPYCKQCHLRNFSTRDLRHANLPQASPPRSTPTSPTSRIPSSPGKLDLSSLTGSPPAKRDLVEDTPIEPPAQPFSFPPVNIPEPIVEEQATPAEDGSEEKKEDTDTTVDNQDDDVFTAKPTPPPVAPKRISIYSRRPMSPVYSPDQASSPPLTARPPVTPPKESSSSSTTPPPPQSAPPIVTGFTKRIVPMSTGGTGKIFSIPGPHSPIKRTYTGSGALTPNLTGQSGVSSPKRLTPNFTGGTWGGGGRVECPKCGKAVYHAEGVNAVGKRWHKSCLRCTECTTGLDSTRLADRDGEPYCRSCYSKKYGPQGSGYALLGKAG